MRTHYKMMVVLLLLLSSSTIVTAQYNVTFNASPAFLSRNALRLEDFGLTETGISTPYLFTLMINIQFDAQSNYSEVDAVLRMQILREGRRLAEGRSESFTLLSPGLNITNQQLFVSSYPYAIKMTDWDDDFVNQVVGITKLPSARYDLQFDLEIMNEVYSATVVIDVSNPTRLDLITPSDGDEISRLQPMFWWESDFSFFRLMVVEDVAGSDIPQSGDEFASHPYKRLDTYILVGSTGTTPVVSPFVNSSSNHFIYPASPAGTQLYQPLEYGKTYHWMMIGYMDYGTNLNDNIESEIFRFTVIDDPVRRQRNLAVAGRMGNLLVLLEDDLREQFPGGIDLGSITPTGFVTINGVEVSWAVIQNFLQAVKAGAIEIIRAEIIDQAASSVR